MIRGFFSVTLAVSLHFIIIGLAQAKTPTLVTRITTNELTFAGEFHPHNKRLFLARTASSIKLYNIETGEAIWSVFGDGIGTRVLPVLFDLTGDRVFIADLGGRVRVRSTIDGREIAAFTFPNPSARNFASVLKIDANGESLYAADRTVVYEFSLADYTLKRRFIMPGLSSEMMGLFVTRSEVKTLDNNYLTSWSLADPTIEPEPYTNADINALIAVGFADRTAVTGDGALIMLNSENHISLIDLSGNKVRDCPSFIGFSRSSRPLDSKLIVSVHTESVLRVWDTATCAIVDELALTDAQLNDVFPFFVRVANDAATVAVSTKLGLIFYRLEN